MSPHPQVGHSCLATGFVVVGLSRCRVAVSRADPGWQPRADLVEQYRRAVGQRPSQAEIRSWERSLHVLSADLIQAGLDDVEVLLEYRLPLTSKRADVVLCGRHPRTGKDAYVVVELKQWSEAELLPEATDVCVVPEAAARGCTPASRSGATAGTWLTSSVLSPRTCTCRASPTCTTPQIKAFLTCSHLRMSKAGCLPVSGAANS